MPRAKQSSKRNRRSKALPVLGAAGLSLSLAGTASAVPGGPAVNLPTSGNGDGNQVFLGEEEISDVSLATFYVFDREGGDGTSSMVELSAVAAAVMAAEAAAMVVGGATLVAAAEVAITAAAATAAEAAATAAAAAVASALG